MAISESIVSTQSLTKPGHITSARCSPCAASRRSVGSV
jgi:hypothetical protein